MVATTRRGAADVSESSSEITKAVMWLEDQLDHIRFGQVGVTLVLHAGQVVRVERTIIDKSHAVGGVL
jgi:hypothetical protein